MRKPIIAGNWKMNTTVSEGEKLALDIKKLALSDSVDAVLIVPFTHLYPIQEKIKDTNLYIGAQNMYFEEKGAFTGEISPQMLSDLQIDYVIIGHSERRQIFHEEDDLLNKKLKAAFNFDLIPILCVGETLEERKEGRAEERIEEELKKDLDGIDGEDVKKMVIAYEPIWAIGTGETASADDAEKMCQFIRDFIKEKYDDKTADQIRIQYGGSVKPENIKSIMEKENIDGALVGGASLTADSFGQLVNFEK